jgi:hypothetical protein
MRFALYVDRYIDDMESQGRINSRATIRSYRDCLDHHGEDVDNRDPA